MFQYTFTDKMRDMRVDTASRGTARLPRGEVHRRHRVGGGTRLHGRGHVRRRVRRGSSRPSSSSSPSSVDGRRAELPLDGGGPLARREAVEKRRARSRRSGGAGRAPAAARRRRGRAASPAARGCGCGAAPASRPARRRRARETSCSPMGTTTWRSWCRSSSCNPNLWLRRTFVASGELPGSRRRRRSSARRRRRARGRARRRGEQLRRRRRSPSLAVSLEGGAVL